MILESDLTNPSTTSVGSLEDNKITQKPKTDQVFRFTPPSCFYNGVFSLSGITETEAILNLSKPSNVPIDFFVTINDVPDENIEPTFTIQPGDLTKRIEDLLPSMQYKIFYRYKCSDETVVGWYLLLNLNTLCGDVTDDFFEGFESSVAGEFPYCWTRITQPTSNYPSNNVNDGWGGYEGDKYFYSSRPGLNGLGTEGVMLLISPKTVDLGKGTKRLRFWAQRGNYMVDPKNSLIIYSMDKNTVDAKKTIIKEIHLTTEWKEYIVYLPSNTTDDYFAFANNINEGTSGGYSFNLDNIYYEIAPTCKPLESINVSFSNIDKNKVTVNWNDVLNTTSRSTYDIEVRKVVLFPNPDYDPSGWGDSREFLDETGMPGDPNAVFTRSNISGKTFDLTNLIPSTQYRVFVKVNCSKTNNSEWNEGTDFITLCDYFQLVSYDKKAEYCGPHKVVINAKSEGGIITWYESLDAVNPIFVGEQFVSSDFISENKSFYVKTKNIDESYEASFGKPASWGSDMFLGQYSGGYKTQYIVLASELNSIGLQAGPISELKFDIEGSTSSVFKDFSISVGHTLLNQVHRQDLNNISYSYYIPNKNLSKVYSNANEYFNSVGLKTFVFSTPFYWDGESNLVIQIVWNNGGGASWASGSIRYDEGDLNVPLSLYTSANNCSTNALLEHITGNPIDINGNSDWNSGETYYSGNRPIMTFVGTSSCESPFVEVPVTINATPQVKLDKKGVASCDGAVSSVITLEDEAGYTDFKWEPSDGVEGDKDSGWRFTNTKEREYTFIASKEDGCQSIQKVVNYSNSKPELTGGLARITDVCKDGFAELKVMAASQEDIILSENSKVSDQKGQSIYTFGSKYSRQQYIYKATDLAEAGIEQAGYINKISFNTNFPTGIWKNKDYVIRMKLISDASFPTDKFYNDGFYTVYKSSNVAAAASGWQDIILDNAFYWDGKSHVLLELVQENEGGGLDVPTYISDYTNGAIPVQKPENEVGLYRTSNTTSDLVYGTVATSRLDIRFGFSQPTVNWSPVTNLYLDNKATKPYVAGTDASIVYVFPDANSTETEYQVNITSPNNCTVTEKYTVKPIDIGLPKIAAQSFCTAVAVTDLVVDAYPGGELTYYSSATSPNKLNEITKTGTYYVELTAAGCKTSRVSFSVNIVDLKHPTVEFTQRICGAGTIADLKAQGVVNSEIKWYATADAEIPLPTTHTLVDNTTYYVSQSFNNCESEKVAVLVDINDAPRSLGDQTTYICGVTEFGSINLKQDAGSQLVWYGSQTSIQPIANTDKAISGIYYVSQKVNACESPRAIVEVSVQANVPAPTASIQYKCGGGTVNDLEVEVLSGATAEWYANATATTPLKGETGLTSGTYYVAQRLGSCVSVRKAVSVRIISNNAPIVDPYSLCEGAKVKDLKITAATGVTYKWYRNNASTTALSPEDVLTSAPYFVSRIENGCESLRAQVQVTINNRPKSPTGTSPQTFADYAELSNIIMDQPNVSWYLTYDDAMNGNNKLPANRPLENGRTYYGVILGVDGCPSMPIAIETFIVLGINDMDLTKLKYYPNPVHDVLTVSYDTPIVKVDVYDLSGKLVIQRSFDNKTISIDLSGLSSGSYMLNIKTAENSQFVKVVKK